MKSIQQFLKTVLSYLNFRFFSKRKAAADDVQLPTYLQLQLQGNEHDCAPVALAKIMPNIPLGQITQSFKDCCGKWPHGGVTNKEFNITLRNLKIFDRFEYLDSAGMKIKNFLAQKDEVYILLLQGHFTIVAYGTLHDSPVYMRKNGGKVYCSWRLLKN